MRVGTIPPQGAIVWLKPLPLLSHLGFLFYPRSRASAFAHSGTGRLVADGNRLVPVLLRACVGGGRRRWCHWHDARRLLGRSGRRFLVRTGATRQQHGCGYECDAEFRVNHRGSPVGRRSENQIRTTRPEPGDAARERLRGIPVVAINRTWSWSLSSGSNCRPETLSASPESCSARSRLARWSASWLWTPTR